MHPSPPSRRLQAFAVLCGLCWSGGLLADAPIAARQAVGHEPTRLKLRALSARDASPDSTVLVDGFDAPGDGGGGRYIATTQPCSLNGGEGDDGSQVKPASGGGCWLAVFDGAPDVRVWGARDVGSGAATGPDSAGALNNALRWCGAGGGGVNLRSGRFVARGADLVVPRNCQLRFAAHAGWSRRAVGAGRDGSATIGTTDAVILLGPARTLIVEGVVEDAALFPEALAPPTSYDDAQRRKNGFAGTAVVIHAPDAKVANAFIVGFDLCIADDGFERPWIINAQLDCTNGIRLNNIQDVAHVANVQGYAYYLNGLDGTANANGFVNVRGASDNGSGLIRLTLDRLALDGRSSLASGAEVKIRDVGGLTGANGTWRIRVVDAHHVDLLRSSARGVATRARWVVGETAVAVPSLDNIWFGQRVEGEGIAPDTIVRSVDFFGKVVWLSRPTTGAGSALAFRNGTYTDGGLVVLDNVERSGTFIEVDDSLETHFTDIFEYGWRIGYHVKNSTWTIFTAASCDTIVDPAFLCMWWDGSSTLSQWNGGEAGGVAAALLDTTTVPSAVNAATGVNVRSNVGRDPSYAAIVLRGAGQRQLEALFSPNGGVASGILQYEDAGATSISGTMPFLDLFPQNSFAEAKLKVGRHSTFAAGSPYSYDALASWTPVLSFAGQATGQAGGQAGAPRTESYGKADVDYPWLTAKFTILVKDAGGSGGAATISGLPGRCEGSLGASGEGGSMPFVSGMRALTGAVAAMPAANSSAIGLWQSGPVGLLPLNRDNFTDRSMLNGEIRCRIAYRQR